MRINATRIKAEDLQPGDLFSTASADYWERVGERNSIGESVYIRTNTTAQVADDFDSWIWKIEIRRDHD